MMSPMSGMPMILVLVIVAPLLNCVNDGSASVRLEQTMNIL